MSDWDDIDATAAEFVLGTLDDGERVAVSARRTREPQLDAAIRAWEQRLAPLDAATLSVAPSAELFARIEQRLSMAGAHKTGASDAAVIDLLQARVRRWRNRAAVASALAACLMLVLGLRETVLAPTQQSYVAVFQRDDELPRFLLTIDLASRQLTVRPVGAERQPGKTYQLWIASDQLGPAPRSLALLGDGAGPAKVELTAYEPALLHRATFGVSLEQAGGSASGRPAAGALHAKLYPTTP